MHYQIIIIAFLGLITAVFAAPDHRLALDPRLSEEMLKEVRRDIENYVIETDIADGESITLYDGYSGAQVGRYVFKTLSYDSPRSRKRTLREFQSEIRAWAKALENRSHEVLRIPEIIDAVSRNGGSETRIYFVGDFVYTNKNADVFNFQPTGKTPVPLRSSFGLTPDRHPFGCLGRARKEGVAIFMVNASGSSVDSRYSKLMETYYNDFYEAQHMHELQYFGEPNPTILSTLFQAEIKKTERIQEVDQAIVTAKDPSAISNEFLPPAKRSLSSLWICDTSLSNRAAMQKTGNRIAALTQQPNLNYALICFGRKPGSDALLNAYIQCIDDDPQVMAQNFWNAPEGGMDIPGGLYSALRVARDHLRSVRSEPCEITVMSDVSPKEIPGASESLSYKAMVNDLIQDGHRLIFVKSTKDQNTDWIEPNTFEIREL
jgi:hypothetical protein